MTFRLGKVDRGDILFAQHVAKHVNARGKVNGLVSLARPASLSIVCLHVLVNASTFREKSVGWKLISCNLFCKEWAVV